MHEYHQTEIVFNKLHYSIFIATAIYSFDFFMEHLMRNIINITK